MATDTPVGAGELFRTMIVQRPPCSASRIGKTVLQVYSCRLTWQEALSCVDARSQNSVPYEVLAFTDATAFGEVVTTTTLNPDFDGSPAMIENRFVEGPAGRFTMPARVISAGGFDSEGGLVVSELLGDPVESPRQPVTDRINPNANSRRGIRR